MTDAAIAETMGAALRSRRLRLNMTQAALAAEVAVSRQTINALEQGSGKLEILISALRALNALDMLTPLCEEPLPSPREAVMRKRKPPRQRATGKRSVL